MNLLRKLKRDRAATWRLLVWGAPLALAVAVWAQYVSDPNAHVGIEIDRRTAIKKAQDVVRANGVDATEWTSGARVEVNNNRFFLYEQQPGLASPELNILRRIAPETLIAVRLYAPDNVERFDVWLNRQGEVLKFTHTLPRGDTSIADSGMPGVRRQAAQLAQAFAAKHQDIRLGEVKADEQRRAEYIERTLTYPLTNLNVAGATAQVSYRFANDLLLASDDVEVNIDRQLIDGFPHQQDARELLIGCGWAVLGLLIVWSLYRYLQLSRQKEVPHRRTLALIAATFAMYVFVAWQFDMMIFDGERAGGWLMYVIAVAFHLPLLVVSVCQAAAYSSSEASVREWFAGKFTSLDAILNGRVWSRNVGRAWLVGLVAGCWLTFASEVPLSLGNAHRGLDETMWKIMLGQYATLLPIVLLPFYGFQYASYIVLLPLAAFYRRTQNSPRARAWTVFLIGLCLVLGMTFSHVRTLSVAGSLWQAGVVAAILTATFFLFDALAAMTAIGFLYLVSFAVLLTAQPSASLTQAGYVSIGLAVLLFSFAALAARRAPYYAADEVKPLYAKYLAERLQMQAEVSAAREAQIRLLPAALPSVEGLSLAAGCQPARVVGGDFYDVYPLADGRVAIFVAEGGERGLEAALTIAYAKGFLMPRLRINQEPCDILCHLQTQIQPLLTAHRQLGVAFIIVDAARACLHYARTGASPRIFLARGSHAANKNDFDDTAMFEHLDRQLDFDDHATGKVECLIRTAKLDLQHDDAVMILTDGISRLSVNGETDEAPRRLMIELNGTAKNKTKARRETDGQATDNELQTRLAHALSRLARVAQRRGIEDDLTAVVLKFESDAARHQRLPATEA